MEVVVLGCGPSSSIPALRCVLRGTCLVCHDAQANPDSKNRRLNPSIMVRNLATDENVLIDCGKTFREAVLRVFPSRGIQYVDAVVLTHGHADACLGLDDLREVQRSEKRVDPNFADSSVRTPAAPMEVHCSPSTQKEVAKKFDYLIEKETREPGAADTPKDGSTIAVAAPRRWVAQLRMCLFTWFEPFKACDMTFIPLPVLHGADYISAAFEFGQEVGARFVYISDVSALPDETRAYLTDPSRPRIDVLMIDALYIHDHHATHMNLEDALAEVKALDPKRTLLTGMGHDFDYESMTVLLTERSKRSGQTVQMAFDGMSIAL